MGDAEKIRSILRHYKHDVTLGIGANAVMFEVVDRLLLSPPQHIVDSDEVRLLRARARDIRTGEIGLQPALSYLDYQEFLAVDAFTDVAAYTLATDWTVGRGEAANRARVTGVSGNFFALLGARPTLGSFFNREEDPLAANPIAVLAHEYWDRRYGRDPDVLGRTVDVGELNLTVIGIAPAGFTGAELAPVDIWIPISEWATRQPGLMGMSRNFHAVARLNPGVAVEAAEAEATARHRGGRAESIAQGRYNPDAEIVLAPIIAARGPNPMSETRVVRWLAGVSLAVLLIACFNVANLLLARSIRTRREIAVRLALGASRRQLMGELLAESLVLATLGAGAALLVAGVLGDVVHEILLPNVAFTSVGLAGRLFGFALIATLATGLLTGLIPALQATKTELSSVLRNGGHSVAGERSKTRIALTVGQVALTVVLLVGAGLFVRSLSTAQELDLGFDPQNIVAVRIEFDEALEPAERRATHQTALEGIRRLPGVHSAGLTRVPPFMGRSATPTQIRGFDPIRQDPIRGPWATRVSSGYFEAMGLSILRGRGFEAADDIQQAALVAVINETMATAFWPGGGALGACMEVRRTEAEVPCTEVVGIVEDHRIAQIVEDTPRFVYFLNLRHPSIPRESETLIAGMRRDGAAMVDLIRNEAASASAQIRFVNAILLSDRIEPQIRSWRLGASMFTAFGFLALIVAGWGLFSVLTFDVVLRQSELGIRSALGASAGRLVRLVLRQAVAFVAVGIGIGLFTSWAVIALGRAPALPGLGHGSNHLWAGRPHTPARRDARGLATGVESYTSRSAGGASSRLTTRRSVVPGLSCPRPGAALDQPR